jgi:hypothetical protein
VTRRARMCLGGIVRADKQADGTVEEQIVYQWEMAVSMDLGTTIFLQ